MTAEPGLGDACSLVDAFRAGTLSPTEALDGSLAAIDASSLNAVCFIDEDRARANFGVHPPQYGSVESENAVVRAARHSKDLGFKDDGRATPDNVRLSA